MTEPGLPTDATPSHPPAASWSAEPAAAELGVALSHGLDLPLTALRAAMESLGLDLDGRARGVLDGALQEVDRLGRNVRDLIDFAVPPQPMPLRCTPGEIARSARNRVPLPQRDRVLVARLPSERTILVDGPLLARTVARLVENALEAGADQVLLVVRQEQAQTRFTVVDDAPEAFDEEWALSPFRSSRRNHLGVGLAIAQRDLAIMHGSLCFQVSPAGDTCVTVTIPHVPPQEAAA